MFSCFKMSDNRGGSFIISDRLHILEVTYNIIKIAFDAKQICAQA